MCVWFWSFVHHDMMTDETLVANYALWDINVVVICIGNALNNVFQKIKLWLCTCCVNLIWLLLSQVEMIKCIWKKTSIPEVWRKMLNMDNVCAMRYKYMDDPTLDHKFYFNFMICKCWVFARISCYKRR